jgi:NTE family protein
VLVERGYDVRVVTPVPFYRGLADLLDPGFVDVAAAAGANQAHDIAVDLRTRWS